MAAHRRVRTITRTTHLLCLAAAGLLLAWIVIPLLLDLLNVGTP
jgi:hypothetical protein